MTTLSKEEYLKRYLSGDTKTEKRKKKKNYKKVATIQPRMRIIDNDAEVPVMYKEKRIILSDDEDEEDFELKPTISHMEDERPTEVKIFEEFKKSGKWRTFDGEDLTAKHIVEEVIKLEPGIKTEPLEEYETRKHKKKRKKRDKADKGEVRVKVEPNSPRVIKKEVDSDTSPVRRQRHDSDDDMSPPRQRHDSDASPQRRRHDSDASPYRKTRKTGSDSDMSPPRKKQKNSDSDISPPRRGRQNDDSDQSPPRTTTRGSDSDISPPRRNSENRMSKTLDGKRAGLQKAGDLKTELEEIRRKERRMFESMDTEVTGRFAETKVRGRLKEAEEKKRLEKEKKEVPEEIKKKFEQWNRGVKQVQNSMEQLEDNLYEMSKPLTRTEDDKDRDCLLKEKEREEDPMLAYMRKKKEKVQGKVKKLPKYAGPQPPPNRFGIWPGYRWDGVVRSNGFEQKLLTRDVEKNAKEIEAYKWNLDVE